VTHAFAREKCVIDRARIIPLEPAEGSHRTAAFAVRAGIHHDHAVSVSKKQFGVAECAEAVVRDAVKQDNPVAIRVCWPDFPAAQQDIIGCVHIKVFHSRAGAIEASGNACGVGCSQRASPRMQDGCSDRGAGKSGAGQNQESRSDARARNSPESSHVR